MNEPSRFALRAMCFASYQSFFSQARKIPYAFALIKLKGSSDTTVRTEFIGPARAGRRVAGESHRNGRMQK